MTAAPTKYGDQFHRSLVGTYRPTTANADNLTVEVTMSTETPYVRMDEYGTMYNEVLSHDPGHVRLDRMNSGAPTLDNHNRHGSVNDNVVGVVESARIDTATNEMVGVIRFDTGETGRSLHRKVSEGILRKFSIGYTRFKYVDTEVEGQIATRTITDWQPYELSVVAVPADNNANSRSNNLSTNSPTMKEKVADNGTPSAAADDTRAAAPATAPTAGTQARASSAPVPQVTALDVNEAVVRTLAAERTRSANIHDQVRSAGLEASYATELVNAGTSELDASRAIVAKWSAANPIINGNVTPSTIDGGDEARAMIDGMAGTLMRRAGMADGDMTDAERRYENMDMSDMCRSILEYRNESTTGLTKLQIVKQAFTRGSGYHSSTDFPIIFGNVINRSLQRAYSYQARTFLAWTSATTHTDFRTVEKARLSSLVGSLDRIPEGGEYKAGTFTESKEGYAVHKYGTLITYTWEQATNDDLGFLKRVPAAFALAAAQRQSDLVYAILTGNPDMNDGVPLFHADHKNLGTPGVLSNETLTEADKMFMDQTDSNGVFINVVPKYLIVGTANKHLAKRLMSAVSPNNTSDVNLHSGAYELIVEPRLGNAWFLAADPNSIDTIEYATLAGHPELYTEATDSFNIDGTQLKARMVFGVKALDWRGLFMNAGA